MKRLIDANKLKDRFESWEWYSGGMVKHMISHAPTVKTELAIKALEAQGWIPVKTRELTAEEKEEHPDSIFMWDCPLPDTPQDVLITTKWGDVQLCTFCADDMGSYFDEVDWDFVLAWMPLPEPYKKEETT